MAVRKASRPYRHHNAAAGSRKGAEHRIAGIVANRCIEYAHRVGHRPVGQVRPGESGPKLSPTAVTWSGQRTAAHFDAGNPTRWDGGAP